MSGSNGQEGVGGWVAGFSGATVRYRHRLAVDRVTLGVREGQVYALLGRNGAGKSSLVRCLLGQQRLTAGRALLFGEDAWASRPRAMARVGVLPEESDLPPDLDADALVAWCQRVYRRWDGARVRQRLRRTGVPPRTPVNRLSRGQRTQLALTLALGHGPELLILDDPTLGLDAVARREVWDTLIGELADRGTTVFLATHDLAGVAGVADRVGVLVGGRLALDEEVDSLRLRLRRLVLPAGAPWQALAPMGILSRQEALGGIEVVVERFDDAFLTAVDGGPLEVKALTLEEIFVAVTTGQAGGGAP